MRIRCRKCNPITPRSKKELERAKSLYVRIVRQAIALDRTGQVLEHCAIQLMRLYINPSIRDMRYILLRRMWRWDRATGIGWHEWCWKNGYNSDNGFRKVQELYSSWRYDYENREHKCFYD